MWWEILLVKQTGQIIDGKQKLIELSVADPAAIETQVASLHQKKQTQVMMVVGEGTVFLLLLLYGIYKVVQSHRKELALTNQQKNFFLSITHELKTPIAATKLQLQTLQKYKLDEAKQSELLANALKETERLNSLIDNVLLASRLESGEFTFRKQKTNISELLENLLLRYYKPQLQANEIKTAIEKDIFLNIDENVFPSVITNLVDNALKYSFAEKNIHISLKRENSEIIFSVADTGCGVNEKDSKKIFTRFYRAGNEETRSAKGTGLGLYITDYITKNHQGEITVKQNVPKGSIFEIRFYAS
ncbi:MAG: HAMP domain-containing histidine kinase [Bacteroidetes bacterium]|nr:HAMP domain-containing histidine kinase [Bacteroidota bacterium]